MESKNKSEGGRERRERDGNKEWRVRTRGRVGEREKGEGLCLHILYCAYI